MTESQPHALEVYIRFNNDNEKDYAFTIDSETTFNDLFKIFDTLPISLRPSIFYSPKPAGFAYSTNPGYLTANGALLFPYNVTKPVFVKKPKSQLDRISDYVWPNQLILPQWQFNQIYHFNTILLLLGWLYTDLPDFISPTPGICLTNQSLRALAWALAIFQGDPNHFSVQNLLKETEINGTGKMGQIFFFIFHIFKILIVYGMLYFGMINPVESNPFNILAARFTFFFKFLFGSTGSATTAEKYQDLKPQDLINIGWTGSRRQCIDDYKENYRQNIIEANGGIVKTHQKGLLKDINEKLGVLLDNDEGFGTPLPANHAEELKKYPLTINNVTAYPEVVKATLVEIAKEKDLPESEEDTNDSLFTGEDASNTKAKKFKLSYKYFSLYNINFLAKNNLFENEDFQEGLYRFNSVEAVKKFRQFGSYADLGASWKAYFESRNKLGNYGKGDRFADTA